MFEKMTLDDFTAVTRPKVQGTWNLHSLFPQDLDFFIMLSSVSGVIGNASQAAYAGANTFMDAFAEFRNSMGLPAVTIDLGVMLEIGYVAENAELGQAMERQGFEGITEDELMAMLHWAVMNPYHGDSRSQLVTGLGSWDAESSLGHFAAPLFSHFRRMAKRVPGTSNDGGENDSGIRAALSQVTELADAEKIVCSALVGKISALGMVAEDTIRPSRPMSEYGIDSLVAVEMRNWIFREMDYTMAILELMANKPIERLAATIARGTRLVDGTLRRAV